MHILLFFPVTFRVTTVSLSTHIKTASNDATVKRGAEDAVMQPHSVCLSRKDTITILSVSEFAAAAY
jgi:hypothetical protein